MAEDHDGQMEVAYAVGDAVSGRVTYVDSDTGLLLDVDGWVGGVLPDDLADEDATQDRYAVGETIDGLFVWGVNHEPRYLLLSAKRNASGYLEALQQRRVGDVVSGTITEVTIGLWLDVDGLHGVVGPEDLNLAEGESTQDRYAVGQTIDGLFVSQVDHERRRLVLSVKRNAPGYVEALQRRAVGDVVSATVAAFTGNGGLWLHADGLVGVVGPQDLNLAEGESTQDRYDVGENIDGLFVWGVEHEDRHLLLSAKRNAPGYVEALQRRVVGDVVSTTVAAFTDDGSLWLHADGLVGVVGPQDLNLAEGESTQDRYDVGENIDGLFVWGVEHEDRHLLLSAKRNAPGYVEALQRHAVGAVVSGTIACIEDDAIGLDVDGLVGLAGAWELDLTDGESARDRYAVGQTIEGLFVWGVDHEDRHLLLSAKRNASGYIEVLEELASGDAIDGVVTHTYEWGILLSAAGVVGSIPASELTLDEEESPQTRYAAGDSITARVWQIDHEARHIILSVRRLAADFVEESVVLGEPIDAVVRGTTSRDIPMPIRVMAANHEVWIPAHELALTIGAPTHFKSEDTIRPIVVAVDEDGRPTRLSLRRALDGWDTAAERLSASNFLVPNARIVPREAITKTELRDGSAAVDLGPILGLISREELSLETGEVLMKQSGNLGYGVVVDSIDRERGFAYVSHNRFEERWREVAGQLELEEDVEVDGELRDFDGEAALLDLGSGLLAQMPARELPGSDPLGKAARDRIGEPFPLRITAIDRDKQTVHVERRHGWLETLIGQPESQTLEFKEILKGDFSENKKQMTRTVIQTICAFVNTDGGRLIIGVDDKTRKIVGLEDDRGLKADTIDGKIDTAIQILDQHCKKLKPFSPVDDLSGLVKYGPADIGGKTLLVVTCERGPDAGVYLDMGAGKKEFWIRKGASKEEKKSEEEIRAYLLQRREQRRAAETEPS